MNGDAADIYKNINRYVFLLSNEKDEDKRKVYLDRISDLNADFKRLCDSK